MKSRMVGLFTIVLIALMVAGFAYAHWSETLVLEGTVKTGELDLTWSCECGDNDDELKNVGEVSCKIEGDTLTITVKNAYPGYEVYGEINITNTGTVPAKYKSISVEVPDGTALVTVTPYYEYKLVNATTRDTLVTISLTWNPPDFLQIDKGEICTVGFVAHFEEKVAENWSGEFKIEIIYENWSPL